VLIEERDLFILARRLLAVVLGGAIGYERELAAKPAGLRTHMLVATGTTLHARNGDEPVEGLTTAASILFTAVIGIAVALEQYAIAVGATVIVLLITAGPGRLAARLGRRHD
jgi:putative Mg2+ transporter-C (MgtC) family protein